MGGGENAWQLFRWVLLRQAKDSDLDEKIAGTCVTEGLPDLQAVVEKMGTIGKVLNAWFLQLLVNG